MVKSFVEEGWALIMKLTYLIDELITKGGTEKHLWDLAHGMAERGHEVAVVALSEDTFGERFAREKKCDYQCLAVRRIYDLNGLKGFLELVSLLRRSGTQILQTFHTASDLIGPLAGYLARKDIVTVSSRRDLGYTKSSRHVRAQRFSNRFVNYVLSNSLAVQESVVESEDVQMEKLKLIYNGIEVQPFLMSRVAELHGEGASPSLQQEFFVGTVANLRFVKGVHVLLKAAKILVEKYSDIHFLIAGDGEEKKRLELLCEEYGLGERVSFNGWFEDVPEFLSRLRIYVQPSLTEGFSNSVLEAMATGLPVVATKVGGNREIIDTGREGILVDANDYVGLAGAIDILYQDKNKRIAMGEQARNKVVKGFTLEGMLNSYESFYASCITG